MTTTPSITDVLMQQLTEKLTQTQSGSSSSTSRSARQTLGLEFARLMETQMNQSTASLLSGLSGSDSSSGNSDPFGLSAATGSTASALGTDNSSQLQTALMLMKLLEALPDETTTAAAANRVTDPAVVSAETTLPVTNA